MSNRLSVLPQLPPGALLRPPPTRPPFPLGDEACTLWASVSSAMRHGAHAVGLKSGDAVLVPAQHHGREVAALRESGLAIRLYTGTPALEPDEAELESLLAADVRGLYLIHHLGFPQDAVRWQAWCAERSLLLLEDVTQAWMGALDSGPLGSFGALAIFSLRDSLGLPDGAVLRTDPPASGSSAAGPSAATVRLLPHLADQQVAARRRAHYALLLEELASRVPAPFDRLPAHAAPFAFPITDDGDRLAERLSERGVASMRLHWNGAPPDRFPEIARRRGHTLLLPVHQELRPKDIDVVLAAVRGRRTARAELRLEAIESPDALRVEWSALAERVGNVFATPEWTMTWWRHFGAGRPLHLLACRGRDGGLVALLPLYLFKARPLRIVRFVGYGPSDQLGPVCEASDRPAVARALRRAIVELRADVLLGDQLPAEEGWDGLLGAPVLVSEATPVLRYPTASWEELQRTWAPNVGHQIRRRSRQLEREIGLSYRVTTEREQLHRDLDTLFALHLAPRGGQTTHFASHQRFHRDFAGSAFERGWLRLLILELGGHTAAAIYGFRFADSESFYQSGRDPGWNHRSVGTLVLAELIRQAQLAGMREFRFLRGAEPYKLRFANADPGLQTIALARGRVRAPALTAALAVRRSVVKPLRRRLGR